MMTSNVFQPIILLGGASTRLYPLCSTTPKPFLRIGANGTLLEQTLERISTVSNCLKPLLIMNRSHKLPNELASWESQVIYEDYANDTGVAVAKVAVDLKQRYLNQKVFMIVLPADHYICNVEAFVYDINSGLLQITDDNIVLYGIDPNGPETKYGYIVNNNSQITFREKPNREVALQLIEQGALWNSGIFAGSTDLIYKLVQESSYNIMDWVNNPREGKAPSFDVAILQEYTNLYVHHCINWKWSDVGTWDEFIDVPIIKEEMSQLLNVKMSECNNVSVLNRGSGNIVLIGCNNLLVVANGSDILIMSNNNDYSVQLKTLVSK